MQKQITLFMLVAAMVLMPGCWCGKKKCCDKSRETGPQQHLSERDMK